MAKVSGNDAPKAPGRLQGAKADIKDLVLRSTGGSLQKAVEPENVALEVGPAILPTPMLTRTIDGASSISLEIFDPERTFLRNSLLAKKWEAEIDGLGFRYVGLAKSGQNLTLTLEDEWVARLKEHFGPKEVLRKNSTRAQFIKRLVEEACPGLDFYCPQLKVRQPIGSKSEKANLRKEAKELKQEAAEDRGPGIGDVKGLNIEGVPLTPSQKELAETACHIANAAGAPFRVQVALISALIAESTLGDGQPGNVLAALEPYTKVRNAAEEISGFLTGHPEWTGITAMGYARDNPSATFYQIAQAVQKSEFEDGSNYAAHGSEAREIVEAFWGDSEGGAIVASTGSESKTVEEPYRFEVEGVEEGKRNGKPENYWEAIKRLAKEVNWRAFISANRFYFMPETELIRSMVRLAIDEDTPGVEFGEIGFEYNEHGDVTEATIPAFVEVWKPPPGSVVTLADMGPVSLGPGDVPLEKGTKSAIDSAVKASTHEGRGRFLVSKIEVPLIGDPAQRLGTITLKSPTRPLPERLNEKKSVPGSSSNSTAATPGGVTAPIQGSPAAEGGAGAYAAPRVGHVHSGVDVACPVGTACYAPVDGKITSVDTTSGFSGGGIVHFEFTEALGPIPKGAVIGWGHIDKTFVSPGPVKGGTKVASSGEGEGGPCVHFIYLPDGDSGGSQWDGIEPQLEQPSTGVNPTPIYEYLRRGS